MSLAYQVAILGKQECWVEAYTKATYKKWFEEGDPTSEEPNISISLAVIGQYFERVLKLANSFMIIETLDEETN